MLDIIKAFFRIGTTSFGGPLVAFALVEEEVVGKRKWLTHQEFAEALALVKVLPGPTVTQLIVHVVRKCRGRTLALVAALSFLLPAYFLVLALGIFLGGVGPGADKNNLQNGMAAATIAIILQSTWRLGKGSIKNVGLIFIGVVAAIAVYFFPGAEPFFILAAGALGVSLFLLKNKKLEAVSLLVLVYIALKASLFSFGTGLAIVPLLKPTIVDHLKLLSEKDFMEAVVLGQVTPGPVIMTVAWVGYKVAGFLGSLVSLFFIFTPGILICLFLLPMVEKKTKGSEVAKAFYSYAIAAVIGAMAAVTLKLGIENLNSIVSWSVFLSCLILIIYKNAPGWFLIPFFGLVSLGLNKIPFQAWIY